MIKQNIENYIKNLIDTEDFVDCQCIDGISWLRAVRIVQSIGHNTMLIWGYKIVFNVISWNLVFPLREEGNKRI